MSEPPFAPDDALASGTRGTFSDSDVGTATAPPFRPPMPGRAAPPSLLGLPRTGQTLHDFELLAELGSGSFARVFLARQLSLGRQVALKVSLNRGQEGRTLASLEHEHIVRVFSEVIDRERDLRLLCMQYVPGTALDRVIERLARLPPEERTGRAFLAAVDDLGSGNALFDLAGLRVRQLVERCDPLELVCWLGARLAEALAHAHRLGVLHRDIKPANVLINPYGRPLLADFNVSARLCCEKGEEGVGGTIAYMAPEHLEAFDPERSPTGEEQSAGVDARADVYSLGVVLFELLTGRLPFRSRPPSSGKGIFRALAAERRANPPPFPAEVNVPPALERVLRRCLAPDPAERFASSAELAAALDACREVRRVEKDLPAGGALTRYTLRHPFLMAALLCLLPHVLGSVVNISYNSLRIIPALDDAGRALFPRLVLVYNAIAYPFCLFLLYRLTAPVFRTWRQLNTTGQSPQPVDPGEVDRVRARALSLPRWGIFLACLGWLPGGVLFPLLLAALAGSPLSRVFGAFVVSFTVSGLIALTYSVFAVQFVVLRVLYPRLWVDAHDLRTRAAGELDGVDARLGLLTFFAVLIPLAGATLLIGVGPEQFQNEGDPSYLRYRLLVTALLALGMTGLGVAILVTGLLRRTLAALLQGSGIRSQESGGREQV